MMRLTKLHPDSFRRTPWKNGGGVSITIAGEAEAGCEPVDWQRVIWQFGRTSIVVPGAFSDLTGYERLQTVVAGRGLVLETSAGEVDLKSPLTVRRYDGGLRIRSRLEAGPVEVVNLIARRSVCAIDLTVLREGAGIELPAGVHIAYAFGAAASVSAGDDGIALAAGHAVRVDGAAQVRGVTGETLIASIRWRDLP